MNTTDIEKTEITVEKELLKELNTTKTVNEQLMNQLITANNELDEAVNYAEDCAAKNDRELKALETRIVELETLFTKMLQHSNIANDPASDLIVEIAFTDPLASEIRVEYATLLKKNSECEDIPQ